MNKHKLKEIIEAGENISVEFKECSKQLNKDVFQSVCAFLNRHGGHLFLGVSDSGQILGINAGLVEKVKNDFVTSMNNANKMSPTFYLSIEEVDFDGKLLLYIFVPESSQVHRCNGRIYDRNQDGDFDITGNTNLVSMLYIRKQSSYTENRIYPYAEMDELKQDLFIRVRKMAANLKVNHPWIEKS